MRPYYAEGFQEHGLRDRGATGVAGAAAHRWSAMASGSLLTKIHKAYQELDEARDWWMRRTPRHPRSASHRLLADLHGRRQGGTGLLQAGEAGHDRQVAGHRHARRRFLRAARDAGHQRGTRRTSPTRRSGRASSLLAECEGVFAETAGGVTVGVARKLIASGRIPANESAVLCITGQRAEDPGRRGWAMPARPQEIKPSLREFEALDAPVKIEALP